MRLALAGLVLAGALAAQAAPPVAFVSDVRGAATIEGDGKLGFLAELSQGTRVLLGTGATATITYAATGAEFAIAGPGEFTVAGLEVKADKGTAPRRRNVATLADPAVVARVSQGATASVRMRSLGAEPAPASKPLSPEAKAQIAKARLSARTFPDRVLVALRLQELGATDEAREAWAALARERPDLPELAAFAR